MKNTNTNEFRQTVYKYLCDSVYDFEGNQAETAKHICERFESEYNYKQNRQRLPNLQNRVAEWLAGLPLNIDYTYAGIIATAEKWHDCKLTESQADMICERWFAFLAMRLLQLWKLHDCEPS